jgi:hypothetical protein
MKTILRIPHLLLLSLFVSIASAAEWQVLFDGSSLDGWKHAEENQKSARIENGVLVLNGERCHLYWVGDDGKASFQNFEAEIVFQTEKNANSGLFFHTQWQAKDWPGNRQHLWRRGRERGRPQGRRVGDDETARRGQSG